MLELKTIFVYSAAINLFMVAVATVAWLRNPGQKDVVLWCLAGWLIVAGGLIMSTPDLLPYHFSDYLGGVLYISSTGFLRLGFLEFYGQRYRPWETIAVAAVVFAGLVLADGAEGTGTRVALLYAGSAINLALTAKVLWDGKEGEILPSRTLATLVFGGYALFNILIVPMAIIEPITFSEGTPVSSWLGPTSILLVLFNMAGFLMAVMLKLERAGEAQRYLAERDALTGVLNRRMFLKLAEEQTSRGGAVAVIDLDHFKRINDTYGHIGGDEALVGFARLVVERLPPEAVFGRIGGEEFGLYLPGLDKASAFALLDLLRCDLEALEIESQGQVFSLTMSCGFIIIDDFERDLNSWIADADCALYAVKNTGRNRVMAFDPSAILKGQISFPKSSPWLDAEEEAPSLKSA